MKSKGWGPGQTRGKLQGFFEKARSSCMDRTAVMSVPAPRGQTLQPQTLQKTVAVVTTLPWATFTIYGSVTSLSGHARLLRLPLYTGPGAIVLANPSVTSGPAMVITGARASKSQQPQPSKPPLLAESGKAATGAAGERQAPTSAEAERQ